MNDNRRSTRYYKMVETLPKDARENIHPDLDFLNEMDEHDFQYYLDWEKAYALERYNDVQRCIHNPARGIKHRPLRPNFDGKPVQGSDPFDSIPESYSAETLSKSELVTQIYKLTDNGPQFKERAKELWFQGYFEPWSWNKF